MKMSEYNLNTPDVLESIHTASPEFAEQGCEFHIKTVRPFEIDDNDDENILFHVKILTTCNVSTEELLKSSSVSELVNILHEMQLIEEESHLCVQQANTANSEMIIQTGFTVQCGEHNTLKLVQSAVTEKKRKTNHVFLIHIRIFQLKCVLMKEYSTICQYIKLLKVFNPRMQFETTLQIHENQCFENYSSTCIPITGCDKQLCGDTKYYIFMHFYLESTIQEYTGLKINRSSDISPIYPRIYPHCGDWFVVPDVDIGHGSPVNLYIQAVTFQISHRNDGIHPHSHVFMSLHGPEGIPIYPLYTTAESSNFLKDISWKNYLFDIDNQDNGACSCSGAKCIDILQPQYEVCLTPTGGYEARHGYKQQLLNVLVVVDLMDKNTSASMKMNVLHWIKHNWFMFVQSHTEHIKKVVMSSLDKTLQLQSRAIKQDNLYKKCINDIAASISSVLMRSTNEDFRRTCFDLLQVDSSRFAEQKLKDKLKTIATARCNVKFDENTHVESTAAQNSQSYPPCTPPNAETCNSHLLTEQRTENLLMLVENSEKDGMNAVIMDENLDFTDDDSEIQLFQKSDLINFDPEAEEIDIPNFQEVPVERTGLQNSCMDEMNESCNSSGECGSVVTEHRDNNADPDHIDLKPVDFDCDELINSFMDTPLSLEFKDSMIISNTNNLSILKEDSETFMEYNAEVNGSQHISKSVDATELSECEALNDSEEWFDDVLQDVDNWLQS